MLSRLANIPRTNLETLQQADRRLRYVRGRTSGPGYFENKSGARRDLAMLEDMLLLLDDRHWPPSCEKIAISLYHFAANELRDALIHGLAGRANELSSSLWRFDMALRRAAVFCRSTEALQEVARRPVIVH